MLTVQPIRYVADVEASRRFYGALGLRFEPEASVPAWAQMSADAGALGLHDASASQGRLPGVVELAVTTDENLEDLAARLVAAGYPTRLVDEDFGRSLRTTDPDGVTVQVQRVDMDTVRRSQAEL